MRNRILVNGLIILCAVGSGIAVTMKPWTVFNQQSLRAKERVRQMKEAESRRIKLLEDEDRAQSSIGKEERTRKAGFVGPGEVALNPDKK